MASPRIPIDFLNVLRTIGSLKEDDFGKIESIIEERGQTLDINEIADKLLQTAVLDLEAASALTDLLMTLHVQLSSDSDAGQTLIDSLLTGLNRQDRSISEKDISTVETRLKLLLKPGTSLQLRAKQIDVMSAQQRLLRESRVFTDVRPVFSPSEEIGPPAGAVILHTLRLKFYEDGEIKSWFVCLDDSDLENLDKQIKRAKDKSRELGNLLKKAEIRHLKV